MAMTTESGGSGARAQRANGRLVLEVGSEGGTTRLAELRQETPCRALFPRRAPTEPLRAVLVNSSGGLVEGDEIAVEIAVGRQARLDVTTQAAEKIYRSIGLSCLVDTRLRLGPQGELVWRPQESILFDGARLRRLQIVEMDSTSRFLACECVIFGRIARGESFETGRLEDRWRIVVDGRLAWIDSLRIDEEDGFRRREPFAFGEAVGYATVVYAASDAAEAIGGARKIAADFAGEAGATLINGLLVARAVDTDEARLRRLAQSLVERLGETLACAREIQ